MKQSYSFFHTTLAILFATAKPFIAQESFGRFRNPLLLSHVFQIMDHLRIMDILAAKRRNVRRKFADGLQKSDYYEAILTFSVPKDTELIVAAP